MLLLARDIDAKGAFDAESGSPRPVVDQLARFEASAAKRREALGLSPLAKARLGRDLAGMASVELLDRYLREQYGVSPKGES